MAQAARRRQPHGAGGAVLPRCTGVAAAGGMQPPGIDVLPLLVLSPLLPLPPYSVMTSARGLHKLPEGFTSWQRRQCDVACCSQVAAGEQGISPGFTRVVISQLKQEVLAQLLQEGGAEQVGAAGGAPACSHGTAAAAPCLRRTLHSWPLLLACVY